MSEQANIQLVKKAYEAYGRGDVEGSLATMTDDVTFNLPGPPQIPWAGKREGKKGAADFFRLLAEADELEVFEPREFFANGDKVVVLGHYRARARSTGRIVEDDWVQVFAVRDGKISSFTEYYDTATVAGSYSQKSAAGQRA